MILYHYTNLSSYDEIISSKRFVPPTTPVMDQETGPGHCLTIFPPENCARHLAMHCWEDNTKISEVEYFLSFDIPDEKCKPHRPSVYLVPEVVLEVSAPRKSGKKPTCGFGPCERCVFRPV